MGEALLKVLLVDDEPFILQGLKILIDWEQEGFEVVKTAANFWKKYVGKRFPMHIL